MLNLLSNILGVFVDWWQQRGSLTKWQLTWQCKGVELNSWMQEKKWHSLAIIDTWWMFLKPKQGMWAQCGCGWCQQWWQWQWVDSTGTDVYGLASRPLVHHWWKTDTDAADCVKNGVLYLTICSIKKCYCTLFITCSFHGNK